MQENINNDEIILQIKNKNKLIFEFSPCHF